MSMLHVVHIGAVVIILELDDDGRSDGLLSHVVFCQNLSSLDLKYVI